MDILIPFSGFYESWWSDAIDAEAERVVEWMEEEKEYPGLDASKIADALFEHSEYHKAYEHIARLYPEAFGEWLLDKFELEVDFKFDEMTSPRQYNFTTDRIFCQITYEEAHALVKLAGWPAICEQAKQHFTSRDGFISFYSPNPATWGKLREWDANQLSMALYALIDAASGSRRTGCEDDDVQYFIYNWMGEEFYRAYESCVDWDKVKEVLTEAQEEWEEWDAETNPNGLSFPEFRGTPTVDAYVAAFERQNGLKPT